MPPKYTKFVVAEKFRLEFKYTQTVGYEYTLDVKDLMTQKVLIQCSGKVFFVETQRYQRRLPLITGRNGVELFFVLTIADDGWREKWLSYSIEADDVNAKFCAVPEYARFDMPDMGLREVVCQYKFGLDNFLQYPNSTN
jgi:hypothetical protein